MQCPFQVIRLVIIALLVKSDNTRSYKHYAVIHFIEENHDIFCTGAHSTCRSHATVPTTEKRTIYLVHILHFHSLVH